MSRLNTPGCTRIQAFSRSTSRMLRIRDRPTTRQPGTGSAPPESPVPEPRGTMGRFARRAMRTASTTSSVEAGRMTAPGGVWELVGPSPSSVRKAAGSLMQFGAPTTPASSLITAGATGTKSPRMRQPPSIQQLIRRKGEELLEIRLEDQGVDHLSCLSQFSHPRPSELADLLILELGVQL